MQKAIDLGNTAKSQTSNTSMIIGDESSGTNEEDTTNTSTTVNKVTGASRVPVRTTATQKVAEAPTNFTELLEEQKKTNSLLEGILKAIVANGQGSTKQTTPSVPGMSVFGGNSGYMAELNGKSYTPIAKSLDWISEPK
jgi:hypothetical protein